MSDAAVAAFASRRELELSEPGSVRAATPALVPSGGKTLATATGTLTGNVAGTILRLAASRPEGEAGPGTLAVLCRIPETLAYATTIACHDRAAGPASTGGYPAERWDEVRLESIAFEDRFRLVVLAGQDAGWTLELFSPALIAWLAEDAPAGLGFELNEGWLCVLAADPETEPATLWDAAARIAAAIRDEAIEEGDDPDLRQASDGQRKTDAAVAEIEWREPPAGAREAAAAYARIAARKPSVLLKALVVAGIVAVVAFFGTLLFTNVLIAPIAAIAGFVAGFGAGRQAFAGGYLFEDSLSVNWVGIQAFNREYARSRGLERQKLARFHHDHRNLPVPGAAESVQAGPIPGTSLDGLFVMLSDSAELRASGRHGMAARADGGPASYDAMIAEVPKAPSSEAIAAAVVPKGWSVAPTGRNGVVVSRPIAGNLTRTAAGCDEFRERAGALIAGLAR
ncbi:MAG: hypothetical protein U0R51_03305 [Solirubrobacterales bacterium]